MFFMNSLCLSRKSNPTENGTFAKTTSTSVGINLLSINGPDMGMFPTICILNLQTKNCFVFWSARILCLSNRSRQVLVPDLWLLIEHPCQDKHLSISQNHEWNFQPMFQRFFLEFSSKSKIFWNHHLFRLKVMIAKDWIRFLLLQILLSQIRMKR